MKLKRHIDFINEIVYVSYKGLKGYEIQSIRPGMRKSDYGHAIIKLVYFDDEEISLLVETYGVPTDKELVVKVYGSTFNVDEDKFRYAIEKLVYILNKNQLNEYFKIKSINYDKHLESYALLGTDNIVPIDRLEQILTSTKITNSKVKDTGDLDKMIYQTANESNEHLTLASIVNFYKDNISFDKLGTFKVAYFIDNGIKYTAGQGGSIYLKVLTHLKEYRIFNAHDVNNLLLFVGKEKIEPTDEIIKLMYDNALKFYEYYKLNYEKDGPSLTEEMAKAISGDVKLERKLYREVKEGNIIWYDFSEDFIKSLSEEEKMNLSNLKTSHHSINKFNI